MNAPPQLIQNRTWDVFLISGLVYHCNGRGLDAVKVSSGLKRGHEKDDLSFYMDGSWGLELVSGRVRLPVQGFRL